VGAPQDKDFAELLAHVGVPLVPLGQPVRPLVSGARRWLGRSALAALQRVRRISLPQRWVNRPLAQLLCD
jgi:hypothetical protein